MSVVGLRSPWCAGSLVLQVVMCVYVCSCNCVVKEGSLVSFLVGARVLSAKYFIVCGKLRRWPNGGA